MTPRSRRAIVLVALALFFAAAVVAAVVN